jgi:hypothetical protein
MCQQAGHARHQRAHHHVRVRAVEGCSLPVFLTACLPQRPPPPRRARLTCRLLAAPDAAATYRDYPWSPRWGAAEMAARIFNWLKEEVPAFMRTRAAPHPHTSAPTPTA